MDEVSLATPSILNINRSDTEWWTDEEPSSALTLDANEGGLFAGNFVPPPPRPLFLDENVTPDGLTTCDLCTWARHNGNVYSYDANREASGELGWVLTLVIVSLISAVIGAIVMIIVLHCKRMKNTNSDAESPVNLRHRHRPPINTPDDKSISTITPPNFPQLPNVAPNTNSGVWSWLSRRTTTSPSQLGNQPTTSVTENHYTHMEDSYNSVGEALYAELDRESAGEPDNDRNSPAYQNSAYTDPDAPTSSAPSSAYYSDLSTTTVPDRAYEIVGLVTMPTWDAGDLRRPPRLASISENVSVPSDYV